MKNLHILLNLDQYSRFAIVVATFQVAVIVASVAFAADVVFTMFGQKLKCN